MSANDKERFYWLKLQADFFAGARIKKLRRLPEGDTLCVIYLKMLLSSLTDGGFLPYEGIEDTVEEEIALRLDEDEENVRRAMGFFLRYGMVEVREGGILLPDVAIMTGSETGATIRRREWQAAKMKNAEAKLGLLKNEKTERPAKTESVQEGAKSEKTAENQGNFSAGENFTPSSQTLPQEIEIEKEIEIEAETEEEIEKESKNLNSVDLFTYSPYPPFSASGTASPAVKDGVIAPSGGNKEVNKNKGEAIFISSFTKPDVEAVKKYREAIGALADADAFFDYYESNGWRVGGSPMADWQAAFRNFERKRREVEARAAASPAPSGGNRGGYSASPSKPEKTRYGTFDPDEAFRRALERSYGPEYANTAVHAR